MVAGTLLILVATGVLISSFFLGSFYLQYLRGFGPLTTGLLFLPVAVATIIGAHSASHAIGQIGPRGVASAALALRRSRRRRAGIAARTRTDVARALEDVDAVLMCAEAGNARVAQACLQRGIHYLDVSATHRLLGRLEDLDDLAREHNATAVLSVGLVPGVTNLLARYCTERSQAEDVRIGVLLGSGDEHGPAALRWTLDGLGEMGGSWRMRFPAPYGWRTIHRFPFSDQYTLPRTLQVERARTGLCLDSRVTTALLAAARLPVVSRLVRRPKVHVALLAALTRVHLGGHGFAVTVCSGEVRGSLRGRLQSRVTGLTAVLLIRRLPSMPPGVRHIEQLVDPAGFLTELASYGFDLELAGQATR